MASDKLDKPCSSVKTESTEPFALFEAFYRNFQEGERVGGSPVQRFYTIGGYTIELRFANTALVPFITPALKHLAVKPSLTPALTVCLWDSASTHIKMPSPPWSSNSYFTRGEILGYNDERIRTVFHLGSNILSMFDTMLNVALFWIRDANLTPYSESAAPLRTILHWFTRNHGCQLVHAAAVGTCRGGILLVGKGSSGKSTTALACLLSGMLYVGDDYVLLGNGESTPFVYSLYNSAKVAPCQIWRLPNLLTAVSNSERLDAEKAIIFLHEHYPEKVTTGFPVRAILIPRITGLSETRLKKASPVGSLTALAPSTIFQLPRAGHETLQSLTNFVKQVPSYVLELGPDLSKIPEVILDLLHEN